MSDTLAESGRQLHTRGRGSSRLESQVARLAVTFGLVMLAAAPLLLYAGAVAFTWRHLGFDLRYAYLPAARDVAHGLSPYPTSPEELQSQTAYVYPPFLAIVGIPLTILPVNVAAVAGFVLFLAAAAGVLLLTGVRDWRCYAAAFLWAPVFDAVDNVNASLLVSLGLALAWRERGMVVRGGVAFASAIALKGVAWPLVAWPLGTRRLRLLTMAISGAAALALASWAAIGFQGLTTYPRLLRDLADVEQDRSYSLHAVLAGVAAPAVVVTVFPVLAALALFALAVRVGRLGREAQGLALAIAALLAASPVVWQHYLTLLLVPLAATRPVLSPAWLAPFLLWACELRGDNGSLWQTILVPSVAALLVASCVTSKPQARA